MHLTHESVRTTNLNILEIKNGCWLTKLLVSRKVSKEANTMSMTGSTPLYSTESKIKIFPLFIMVQNNILMVIYLHQLESQRQ